MEKTPPWRTWRDFGLPRIADTPPGLRIPAPPLTPRQPDEAQALDALANALGAGDGRPRVVTTPTGLDDVVIRIEHLRHIVKERGQARERFGHFVHPTLTTPLEVWLTPTTTQAGTLVYRRRFVAVFDEEGVAKGHLAVAQENKDESLLWTTYRHGRIDSVREGLLLYRRDE